MINKKEVLSKNLIVTSPDKSTRMRAVECPFLSRWIFLSLTEHTEFTESVSAQLNSVGIVSLTELTDLTEPLCAQFRAHRTPPAYRVHRGLSTKISCNVL